MDEFELAWDAKCATGESPVWDEAGGAVLFADIPAGRIHRYGLADGARSGWTLPGAVGSFGLCRSGRLVVALDRRVVLFDPRDGGIETLCEVDEPATSRLNDGKVGPDGCFWVGGIDERPEKEAVSGLYRVTPEGKVERKSDGCIASNGLAWSADGTTMFHSCSRLRMIDAWDFDAGSGRISRRRRIATLSAEEGRPDGGACDVAGGYWSAGVSAGCLNRFSASGALLEKRMLPVPAPTMPCFVGDTVFVTSLGGGPGAANPLSGGLFRGKLGVRGVTVGLFG